MHTMDGDPTHAYHRWHAIQRGNMVLDIDRGQWVRLNPVLGFAWALQSVAKPDHGHVNPRLPADQVRALARHWLPRDQTFLDRDFRSAPYPSGIE
ncbi:hypothetical protein [Amycolatopsis sp. lyj-23]|uniref:hypothetical protein n=1 Tax=Amycolatopsis sp. lyj-23 TaxID=2789283 RepID=UPI003979CCA7